MKNTSVFIGTVAIAGLLLLLNSCSPKPAGSPASASTSAAAAGVLPGVKIAYVNIDSLDAHYDLVKKRNEEFKAREAQMEQELEQSYQQMQTKGEAIQKRAQTENMSQQEIEAAQKQIMLMQQSFESRKQSLTDQLLKEKDEFNKDIKKKLNDFLEAYNKDKHYDYILSYSSAPGSVTNTVMYANKQLEITKDVIDGMNASSKSELEKK